MPAKAEPVGGAFRQELGVKWRSNCAQALETLVEITRGRHCRTRSVSCRSNQWAVPNCPAKNRVIGGSSVRRASPAASATAPPAQATELRHGQEGPGTPAAQIRSIISSTVQGCPLETMKARPWPASMWSTAATRASAALSMYVVSISARPPETRPNGRSSRGRRSGRRLGVPPTRCGRTAIVAKPGASAAGPRPRPALSIVSTGLSHAGICGLGAVACKRFPGVRDRRRRHEDESAHPAARAAASNAGPDHVRLEELFAGADHSPG